MRRLFATALANRAPPIAHLRGDVARAMLAQGGRKDCPPALLTAWTAAIELDAAPLAALELAPCCALPRGRANALLEKI